MDSAYVEVAIPNCPSEVGECNSGVESVSSLTTCSDLPPMMHSLEPPLDVMNVKLQPDSSEEMPPPNATPGLAQFTTVEFSGFAQTLSETDKVLACESSGTVTDSADQLDKGQESSSAPVVSLASQAVFQTLQHIPASHATEQRPISESAASSPGPSGSCGSGVSPAVSASLSQASLWPLNAVRLSSSDNTATALSVSTTGVSSVSLVSSQSSDTLRSEKPQPPKKPLTPYMRFSKSIWQEVKAANPTLSVCEVGAAIGKLWREMVETEKQRYNEDFAIDKVRYDDELQSYLKLTGLQTSDLPKPKPRRKDVKDRPQILLRPTVPQAMPFGAAEPTANAAPLSCEQTPEPSAAVSTSTNDSANGALRATGFQTVAMSGDCSGLGTSLASLPHFSQVWAGQEVFANQQLLAQIGMAAGQTVYAGQTVGETPDAPGLIAMQSQDTNQNEGTQVTSLYSGQNQSLQNIGSQGFAGHIQMSVDDSSVMTSRDNAWLWQQYNAGNQFVQDMMAQSSLPQSQNQEGIIIYQLTSDGTAQNSLLQSPAETNHHTLPNVMLAKSSVVAAANGTIETVLEPGEIPLSGALQASISNGAVKSGVYDLNQLCSGLASWTQAKDDELRDFVQPVDGEKQLLRSALLEKSKEIQRLTRELELAYGLIHQLKQQTDLYQRHWNGQQQQQLQQQQQQQQQLHVVPKTEVTTGLSISS